jgi:hypothetical protein
MGYMNFKSEIGIENMPGKWTSWILNFEIDVNDLTSKWYVMDLTNNYCLSM